MTLTIWPEHCIIGSVGHSVVPSINSAVQNWARLKKRSVQYVMKGQNCRTEMYSAIAAEVEDEKDPSTSVNLELISKLRLADRIVVCGQALSHCVNYTVRDLIKYWDADLSRLVLVENCKFIYSLVLTANDFSAGCSPVFGYEAAAATFVNEVRAKGMTVLTDDKVFPHCYGLTMPQKNMVSEERDGVSPPHSRRESLKPKL